MIRCCKTACLIRSVQLGSFSYIISGNRIRNMCDFSESVIHQESWDGHMFARTLPTGFDHNYDQSDKPLQRRISFPNSNFSSPASFRLSRSRPYTVPDTEESEQTFANRTSDLTIYLYDGTSESKNVQLFRNADEPLANTLKRIQISVLKKIGPRCKKKNKGSSNQVEDLPSIWKLNSATMLSDVELNISDFSCGKFLKESTRDTLFMKVPVSGFDKPLRILIESNPPTITSVKSFDNLQAKIFTNVPIHIQVKCLYATDSVVDWYAGDQLVQADSHLYIPSEEDIGKELTVLIRPYRTGEHHGEGCQEAYRFTNKVEQCPRNVLLELRPDWTKPRPSTDTNLRVLTYNILADQNCTPSWHPYCNSEILLKQRRFPLIACKRSTNTFSKDCFSQSWLNMDTRVIIPARKQTGKWKDAHYLLIQRGWS